MKYTIENATAGVNILANSHYVAIPYDCTNLSALATNGVISAGTIVPANDATAVGVLLHDVTLANNPNGSLVIHGFLRLEKLPTEPAAAAMTALNGIKFINNNGEVNPTTGE